MYKNITEEKAQLYTEKLTDNSLYHYGIEKFADIPKEILLYIKRIHVPENSILSLVNAVGAGERWGPNSRGDFFTEAGLKHEGPQYGYLTFELYGAPYYRHQTYPGSELGKVLKAFWIENLGRVFVLNQIDREKYQRVTGADPMDDTVSVSMGCVVPEEICSICGFVNTKTLEDRCEHLKYMMNMILPDGRQVYAINLRPKFKDITYTFSPADETAKVMLKVADTDIVQQDILNITKAWLPVDTYIKQSPLRAAQQLTRFGVVLSPSEFDIVKKATREDVVEKILSRDNIEYYPPEIYKIASFRSVFEQFLKKYEKNSALRKLGELIKYSSYDRDYLDYRASLLNFDFAVHSPIYPEISVRSKLLLKNAYGVNV